MAYSSSTTSIGSTTSSDTPSPSRNSTTPDIPHGSHETLRGDTTVSTQAREESLCEAVSVAYSRPQWNTVNEKANEPQVQRNGTSPTPDIPPKVVPPRHFVSNTSSDGGSLATSPNPLSPDITLGIIKTEPALSPLSSTF
jgi:hypothetical protein